VTRLATAAWMREWLTHACNSNRVINLTKQGKLKNLHDEAEGDGAYDWRFSLLFTAEKKLLTTEEPVDAGLRSTMGERGLLVGRTLSPVSSYLHWFSSPVFLIPCVCSGFLLRVPSVFSFSFPFVCVCLPSIFPLWLRWDSCLNGGVLDVHRMEELLRLVQLRGEGEDDVDGDGGLPDCCCFPSISVFLRLPWSSFPKLFLVLLLEDEDADENDGWWWWRSEQRR